MFQKIHPKQRQECYNSLNNLIVLEVNKMQFVFSQFTNIIQEYLRVASNKSSVIFSYHHHISHH